MRTHHWPDASDASSEELILYGLFVLIGAIPVAIALVQRGMFGVDATLGLLMVCLGTIGAFVHVRRARAARTG
jgi:uncharacterized membrane protein YqaE (UPF0057 family)